MNGTPVEQSVLDRVRSLRVETCALLTAVRMSMRAPAPLPDPPGIPVEWMPQYERQLEEKLMILGRNRKQNRN